MRVGMAADHGEFELKVQLTAALEVAGYEMTDFGAHELVSGDNYPDFVVPLARAVAAGEVTRGLAICGSGVGACVAANKMSIQLHEENGGKILVVDVKGKLVKADYGHFVPEFERLVRQHGKLRVMFDMTGFHGWDSGAAWEDIKFDIEHFADIDQLAMVGDKKWQHGMAMFFKPFMKATTRYFDRASEAQSWLGEV